MGVSVEMTDVDAKKPISRGAFFSCKLLGSSRISWVEGNMSAFKKVRRFVLIAMLTIIGIVVVGLVVINALFVINSIPESRLAPPSSMLHIPQPASQAPRRLAKPKPYTSCEDGIRAEQKCPATDLYAKFQAGLSNSRDYWDTFKYDSKKNDELYSNDMYSSNPSGKSVRFEGWKEGKPLTTAQVRWLKDHHDLIEDLLKIDAAGGVPKITCEYTAQVDGDSLARMHVGHGIPDHTAFFTGAELLMCESRRLRSEGNQQAAADALLAIKSWADSYSEPFLASYYFARGIKWRYFYPEICHWIADAPMDRDIAIRLRDAITTETLAPDVRRHLELEYRLARHNLLKVLRCPFPQLFLTSYESNQSMRQEVQRLSDNDNVYQHRSPLVQFRYQPAATIFASISSAMDGVSIKASADSRLERFDKLWAEVLKISDPAHISGAAFAAEGELNDSGACNLQSLKYMQFSARMAEARRSLALATLDKVINPDSRQAISRIDIFTGVPLRESEDSSATLIYSLGPDRVDQHGMEIFDPDLNFEGSGDIVARIPKRVH